MNQGTKQIITPTTIIDIDALNLTAFENLGEFILNGLNVAIAMAAMVAVIFLVYAGFQYILSRGEGDKADKAQKTIIYTLIGLLLVFISPLMIRFILGSVLVVTI